MPSSSVSSTRITSRRPTSWSIPSATSTTRASPSSRRAPGVLQRWIVRARGGGIRGARRDRCDGAERFHEQALFYRVLQPGKNRWGGAFWCGTGAVVRVAALRDVGLVATSGPTCVASSMGGIDHSRRLADGRADRASGRDPDHGSWTPRRRCPGRSPARFQRRDAVRVGRRRRWDAGGLRVRRRPERCPGAPRAGSVRGRRCTPDASPCRDGGCRPWCRARGPAALGGLTRATRRRYAVWLRWLRVVGPGRPYRATRCPAPP